ncbi:Ulp1 protease family C-terminal catalytic domain [Arabidopsis suecica]|uniref:Ulp1 protease family C-terminal catalytic domain n=1 Tax=Arabidopsis suecica TaxID=45249 RepID=A0A8T2BSY0_ARASU|nr:Ulp1 protease family C-terminal catalytic domain [Arabidopsis suecica]
MSTRSSKRGKCDLISSSKDSLEVDNNVDYGLPERVLPRGCYPKKGRLNIYSTPEHLGFIVEVLGGTPDLFRLMRSQFGNLFKYPVSRTPHSAKLIHGLLCRQLVTKKRHELHFVFGGKPMRFSLREFHIATGLDCRPFPSDDEIIEHQNKDSISVWNRLFGAQENINVQNVIDMLKEDMKLNKHLSITEDYVEMLDDIDFFLAYPWGRQAFIHTIERFGPPEKSKTTPLQELRDRLRQKSSCCYGFPLALQLQAFEAIPLLLSKIPEAEDLRDCMQRKFDELGTRVILKQKDILMVEANEQLQVAYTLVGDDRVENIDFGWDEDAVDEKIDYMEKLIIEGHEFNKSEWPGGETSSPCVTENDGKVTEASGQVSPPTGGVKKLPSRRAGVNKEPVKRGGVKKEAARRCETAVKNKKDDEAKKDDGDNIEMLKNFILEQHLETVKTLKAEIHNCFAGLTKCACGGLQSPKNHTTLHQKVGKSDVQVINLEAGKTVTDNKKRKRTEVETESIGNSYDRIRWDKAPLATTKEGRPETTTDATERWEKTANEASDTVGVQVEGVQVEGVHMEGGQATTKEGLPETTTDATERWEKTANEATDTVGGQVEGVHVEGGQATEMEGRPETATDASEGWEKSANEATETEGGQEMEFENEWGSGDDSPFAEHNALIILPSGLEDGNEAMITEPVTDEIDTCGEGEVNNSSSPRTPEELVTKSKRVPRASIFVKGGECTGDAKLKALITSKRKTPDYHPISRANLEEFDEFKNMLEENEEMSYTIVTYHTITNRHFLDIVEAQNPLKTEKYTEFKAYKKKLKFNWGVNVRAIVTGKSKGRLPTTFLKNVDLVYIPMNWSTTHWVGLVINLMQGTIHVLDPLIDASSDEEVMSLMAPFVEMIPWLVKDAIAKEYTQKFSTKPLIWKRVAGLYQNKRGGDSGPVAAKFLEMHAYGLSTDDMGKITDEKVDELRKMYAIDAYAAFIESGEAR